jgi:flagellin
VYATKLYDAKGKEVSAEQIADSKNADGSTATNYYVNEKGAVANAIAITAADAKAKNIQPFDVNGELSFNLHVGADSAADNKIAVFVSPFNKYISLNFVVSDTRSISVAS